MVRFRTMVSRVILLASLACSCHKTNPVPNATSKAAATFDDEVAYLRAHGANVEVIAAGTGHVAITSDYQARIMTSEVEPHGRSLGFVHHAFIDAGKTGTQFGIEFRLDGAPAGDNLTLHAVFIFPPQGIRNPNTGDIMLAAKVVFPNMKIGALCVVGYGFDNAWEIIPGMWTEQIWYQDRMLAERSFTVSKAE